NNELRRDGDSKKSHHALGPATRLVSAVQIRTEVLLANADSTGFCTVLSAMAATTAITAATMQAEMKADMGGPSGSSIALDYTSSTRRTGGLLRRLKVALTLPRIASQYDRPRRRRPAC